jgi:hypothetical protein
MPLESAKGTIVMGAVVTVRRHRDHGRISAEELQQKLSPASYALLDQRIDIASWYPVSAFAELVDVDWEYSGHRDPAYLERQGAMTADRLFDSGLYQQLEYAERSGKVETRKSLERQSRLITTITASLYNFLESSVTVHAEALEIAYDNARSFADSLAHTTVGFMNQINLRQGSKRTWKFERIGTDRAVFEMSLPARMSD